MATGAILDVDDPDVGIEGHFALQTRAYGEPVEPFLGVHARPQTLDAIIADFALRCGTEQSLPSVETVDDDENRACFLSAATAQGGVGAFYRAAAQIGRHPYASLQAHDQLI